ncbi:MAG: Dam family site-specific DNA-(adenine-N6)-methyltransferase [Candidatus Latescibacterota bacterium]
MSNGKPFLRWAGSKKQLIPKLFPFWGEGFTRYIEPFMGSAALFFSIKPSVAILSDINSTLVETFCAVRDHPRAVHNRLLRLPLGKDAYYQIRQENDSQMSPLDRAARFLYLNRFCFNGLYRTNMKGKFNVPYAASKTGKLPTQDDLYKAAKVLSCAQIKARDFETTLDDVQAGDFIYMDPPYAVKNRRIFRQYGPDSFGTEDLARLASALSKINQCGATFLVSYAMCSEALEAFRGWHIRRILTQRSVAGFSRHRHKAVEILVSNREMPERNCSIITSEAR